MVISKNVKETGKIAAILVKKIGAKKGKRTAVILALEGELGAGKTVFVKAFAKALGIKSKITSPTFVILKKYSIPKPVPHTPYPVPYFLYHIDAYRLRDHRNLVAMGIKEILADPQNIVLIEWSDRVQKILPKKHIKIHIDHVDEKTRKIRIFDNR